jgi:general secretion pathway protein E
LEALTQSPTRSPLAVGLNTPEADATQLLKAALSAGLISQEASDRATALRAQTGMHPLTGLLRLNAVAEAPLYAFASTFLGLPLMREPEDGPQGLARSTAEFAASLRLNAGWLAEKGIVAQREAESWQVAFRDELPPDAKEIFLRRLAGRADEVTWSLVPPTLFERVRANQQQQEAEATSASGDDLRALRELAEEGPTIELVNSILSRAVTQRASDVHFEAEEYEFCVRVRVDGEMLEQTRQPRARYDAVACRIKILADLDIAERRQAQDGRINARVNGESFDIRVSVLPAAHGESIVLRLLRQERKPTKLQDLGMMPPQASMFNRWVRLSNGIVLVTGPTGSGKSTTLYTALELANDRSQKIITIEDPIEFKLPGLTQLQVNADIGFTFAAALRSILRHDPDVILVGEIRDAETARIAIQSALTGHLVLSTLHTNSAMGAVTRLIDMGIEPFLISASIRGLMAQRLVRRLCRHCKAPDDAPDEALQAIFTRLNLAQSARPMASRSCAHCNGTGYLGRLAVYDLIEFTPDMGHRLAAGQSEAQLLESAGPRSADGLLNSGAEWIAAGETTLAEVLRAVGAS